MIRYVVINLAFLTDTELLAEYRASEAGASDARYEALAAEIDKRKLDV